MHLWEFVKIGIILSTVLVGIIVFSAGFLVLNGGVGTVQTLTVLNKTANIQVLTDQVTESTSKTTTSGTASDAIVNPLGAFQGVWNIIIASPAIVAGFVNDVAGYLHIPDWFLAMITLLVSAILAMELLGLLFRRDVLH